MKNEDIVQLFQNLSKELDQKLEQRATLQMEELHAILDERLSHVSPPLSLGHGGENSTTPLPTRSVGRRSDAETDCREVNSILKSLRVKVPRFDGSEVDDWIYKINNFFDLHRVDTTLRLSVVAFHLDGTPSTWFQWMEKGGGFADWDSFIQALRMRFGVLVYDDPLGRIAKLTQTGRVSQFRAEFEALMTKITGVSEQMYLNFFVWGLKLEIRRELLISRPCDLADAMAKAQLFEDRNDDMVNRSRTSNTPSGWLPKQGQNLGSPSSGPGFTVPTGTHSNTQSLSGAKQAAVPLPIKRLTPSEMRDKRERGLCFTCDEKYSFGHKCKNRVLVLCGTDEDNDTLLSPEEEETTDGDDNNVDEVSLNALSNSANPRIFRIQAKQGEEKLEVLIDIGSNNNFIQESLATQLRFPWEETKWFKVYMGNGNFLICSKLCWGVELVLQGHLFVVDLYILPIYGLDVVLGMQWLQTLGLCIHDHKALTMEFSWQGSVVKLAGSQDVSPHQLSYSQFTTLLRDGEVRGLYTLMTVMEDTNPRAPELTDCNGGHKPEGT
ncbi:uncharacterized protein LOC133798158 [Humulus lupulus]|uniref:uncharacterized protein LOC133798158 n=1 Tax=Humulus lupulus TaxID=3486 RepID=UPI002B402946|nr:uncharacterized protein LOC133798158 [Humulus lupulus]XP_062092350.1 uncharacterized protein LOC133798158 [Humulus lupulus]XP_062092351.1 uncharacterized protein LOC133798158 [Humulus lupulus]XP_062092352.1 uncharacterized protein LOC133798158 [Humulus lupulus]